MGFFVGRLDPLIELRHSIVLTIDRALVFRDVRQQGNLLLIEDLYYGQ